MSITTFTPPIPPVVGGYQNKPEIKLLRADFGDGYSQAAPDGLNHIRKVVSLRWEYLTKAQADTVVAFFVARGGYDPFLFTEPGSASPLQWTCDDWSDTQNEKGYRSISATFRQSFNRVSA